MIATAPLRTPGLYFEAHVPDPPEVLPRLDIAAFVGFAASGPLDVPVPVEDAARFEEIFGSDLRLGTAPQSPYAQLAPAVRAFFRNGGRRCWVVRVADEPRANHFMLPGVLRVRPSSSPVEWAPATATARSEGSWSDLVAVNTTLIVSPQARHAVAMNVDTRSFSVTLDTGLSPIRAGDLLRIDVGPSWRVAFIAVPADPAPDLQGRVELPWRQAVWLEEADAEPWPFRPDRVLVAARHVLPHATEDVQVRTRARDDASRTPGTLRAVVTKEGGSALREGSWLEIDVRKTSPSSTRATWLLQIDRMWPQSADPLQGAGASVEIEARRAWRFVDPPDEIERGTTVLVSALTIELWTRDASGQSIRLSDLGLANGHARFWGDLPTDAALFASRGAATSAQRELGREASHPRFPLAGPAAGDASVVLSLPLGVSATPKLEREEHAVPHPAPQLVRDGVKRVAAGLFLDRELRSTAASDLVEKAFRIRYADDGKARRPLRGIHALIDLDEVSLVAAPDALVGATSAVRSYETPPGVTLGVDAKFIDPSVWLTWQAVPDQENVAYTLQRSETADFAIVSRSERLVPKMSHELVINEPIGWNRRRVDRPGGACAPGQWYRVRVEAPAGGGPWSNAVRIRPVAATFDPIEQVGMEAPVLTLTNATGARTFAWTSNESTRYVLEWSPEPTFAAAQVLFEGESDTFSMVAPLERKFVRVRAQTALVGAWSNTVSVGPDHDATAAIEPGDTRVEVDPNTALEVNRGLLSFCAARGDVLAVLGAPESMTDEALLAYKTDLVEPFLATEDQRTLSFGALYDPWLVVGQDRPGDVEPRTVAPSGTICGLIAARTLARGAWFAPANRSLAGVVSTARAVDRQSWARFEAAQVNAVLPQPHGFVTLSAHTLTSDEDLREIAVRRLLILLRRLVLREGPSLVFEPNGPDLRRAVRRQFERVLGLLFVRGAFAGSTPEKAFQVVVDDTNNPPQVVDLGRVVVELRVAPSRPLAYLIVRFVLHGAGGALVLEGA
jgi:hypothetical protein